MSSRDGLCDRAGCSAPARFRLSVVLFAGDDLDRRRPSIGRTELVACSLHARLRAVDVISPKGWEVIMGDFKARGVVPPRPEAALTLVHPFTGRSVAVAPDVPGWVRPAAPVAEVRPILGRRAP